MGGLWTKKDARFYSIEIGTPEDDVLLHPPSGVDAGPWVFEDLDNAREVCRLHNAPIKRAIHAERERDEALAKLSELRAAGDAMFLFADANLDLTTCVGTWRSIVERYRASALAATAPDGGDA